MGIWGVEEGNANSKKFHELSDRFDESHLVPFYATLNMPSGRIILATSVYAKNILMA